MHLVVSAPWKHTVEKYWRCTVIWPCLTLSDMCSALGSSASMQGWQQRTARRADLSQTYPKTSVLTFRKTLPLTTWATYRGWASCSRRKRHLCHAVSESLWWTQKNCKIVLQHRPRVYMVQQHLAASLAVVVELCCWLFSTFTTPCGLFLKRSSQVWMASSFSLNR